MESLPVLKEKKTLLRGFTLVEMMVVLIIIALVTTVAVTSQTAFNRSLLLTDTAYTIAFSIREAQSLGLSSRVTNSLFDAGYGVRFSTLTPKAYVVFADTSPASPGVDPSVNPYCAGHTQRTSTSPDAHPGDCIYDASANPTELVRTYSLSRGYNIYKFCGRALVGGTLRCSQTDFETMHISFMRPSTDTIIFGRTNTGNLIPLADATIYLRSPDNTTERCIVVSRVGQIAVSTCP